MVIDINILRKDKGGCPEIVIKSEKNRYRNEENVLEILRLDNEWRELRYKVDTLKRNKNRCSKNISQKIKNGKDIKNSCDDIKENVEESKEESDILKMIDGDYENLSIVTLRNMSNIIDNEIIKTSKMLDIVEKERNDKLNNVGNILHSSVVISDNEDNNKIIREYGKFGECSKLHVDILLMINGADYKKGSIVAGNRGYYLKGPGVLLSQALIQYSLKKLYDKGYIPLYTPFFMKKEIMEEVAQLSQFDDELYQVISNGDEIKNEDKYLIATSEQTIAAYHRNEWLNPDDLPLKYAGLSTCFRKEVGSHGKDTTGIFRVHQFEKVEQFVICSPNDSESWNEMELMLKNSEELYKDLGISYRVVSIVSGALNNAAALKYDIEGWFPGSKAFKELVSCSNCTDYQSRKLGIRYGCTKQQNKEVQFVHMLNSTMCAVTRVLCCLIETHFDGEGINVPECLQMYMPNNMKYIPVVRRVV